MYSAIIVAAGKGERTGLTTNKVLACINGKPIIRYAVEQFKQDPDCRQIIVVYRKEDKEDLIKHLNGLVDNFILGGTVRQESVYNGLLAAHEAYVMIHDGARPYLTKTMLFNLKKAMKKYDAATLALPVVDTIKKTHLNVIVNSVERDNLVAIQTPQAFKKDLIIDAYKKSTKTYTCDASLIQDVLNVSVYTVTGDRKNIKFTTSDDLELLEMIL
ncbi:2-C-methyl-D-erythritol 4-phosphate cytidylyltransferase [Liberiplasma polymorphum]|jgi:2-C-methyl-D-erythritol 4-phosphate cytidylyltransferase|uniref:2-C-methyl-D-erythritol 4-phosphate cytidylyltransferase n=1 Tax=Liberiplasma polymorphum TaxID=3374570 RepID=UPI003774EFF2